MGAIRLLVKSAFMNGGEGSLEGIDDGARVSQLKVLLAEVGGVDIPIEAMRVLHKGKNLNDKDDILSLGLQDRDCIVVIKGRTEKECCISSEESEQLLKKDAPGRLEILEAVNAVQAEARARRSADDEDEDDDDDEEMPDAEQDEDEERTDSGLGSADIFNAIQASAMTGGVEGLEEQLHSILNVLARFDGRARGSSQRSSGDEDLDEEGGMSRAGMTMAEQFFRPPDPNPEYVEQLKEMGFPEGRVRKSLILCRNSMTRATDWLLEHADDDDVDAELTEEEMRQLARNSFLTAQRLSRRFPNSG